MHAHVKMVNAPCVSSAFKYDHNKYVRKQKYMEQAEDGAIQEGQRPTALVILHVVKRPAIIKSP